MFQLQPVFFSTTTWLTKRWWAVYTITGLLLGVGFVYPTFWVLGIIGVLLQLTILLYRSFTLRQHILGSIWAWTIKAGFAGSWAFSVYPINWVPIDLGAAELPLIALYWVTASLWLGLGGLIIVLAVQFYKKYCSDRVWLLPIVVSLAWVLGEICGSLFFSLATLGEGSGPNISFSFGYVGYLIAEHGILIQLAHFGGVYLLSFIVVCAVSVLLLWLRTHEQRVVISSGLLLILLLTAHVSLYSSEASVTRQYETISIMSVNTNVTRLTLINQTDRVRYQEALRATVAEAVDTYAPDYVVMPEDARLIDQQQPTASIVVDTKLLVGDDVLLVDSGTIVTSEGKKQVSSLLYDPATEQVETTQKRYLVPQGEYTPALYQKLIGALGVQALTDYVASEINYETVYDATQTHFTDSMPAVLFCFESVDPRGVWQVIREHQTAPFVAHQISHAWFHSPYSMWHQKDTMLRVQAIWNDVTIVSAGNTVVGKVYRPDGSIVRPKPLLSNEEFTVFLYELALP